jgi:hypothetical protein
MKRKEFNEKLFNLFQEMGFEKSEISADESTNGCSYVYFSGTINDNIDFESIKITFGSPSNCGLTNNKAINCKVTIPTYLPKEV